MHPVGPEARHSHVWNSNGFGSVESPLFTVIAVNNKIIPSILAIAVVAGLVGAVLGSTHPIAAALVSGFGGAIVSSVVMAFCVVSLPHHEFGEREIKVAIFGGAVIFAVLTLCCTKLVTIISSSLVGGTLIILAIDFFCHDLSTLKWVRNWHSTEDSKDNYNRYNSFLDDYHSPQSCTTSLLGWHHCLHVASCNNCWRPGAMLYYCMARRP